jgi:integrase
VVEGPDRDITLAEYAARWLKTVAAEIEPSTLASYRASLRLHVLPMLGRIRLRDLRRRHVKALLNAKRADGYSSNAVRLMKAALSSLHTDAVDDELVETNPALQVGRKKRRAGSLTAAERVQKIKPMTWEQRTLFLDAAARGPRYATLFAVLAKAGLRPGEALALKPGDIDFRERTLEVERAIHLGRVKPTKTHERRRVDLTPELVRGPPPPPGLARGPGARARLGRARVALSQRARAAPGQVGRGQGLPPDPPAGRSPRVPALRPPPHLREPAACGRRPDHLRQCPARARRADDDAAVLREVDPEQGPALGRGARPRRLVGGKYLVSRPGLEPGTP